MVIKSKANGSSGSGGNASSTTSSASSTTTTLAPASCIPIESLRMSESLRNALRKHIIREREKLVEQEKADIVNKKKKEEESKRDNENDLVLLKKNKQQIASIRSKLKSLRCEKHEVFQTLKRVLQDEENRRRKNEKFWLPATLPRVGGGAASSSSTTSSPINFSIPHLSSSTTGPPPNDSFSVYDQIDSTAASLSGAAAATPLSSSSSNFGSPIASLHHVSSNSSSSSNTASPSSYLSSFTNHRPMAATEQQAASMFTHSSFLPYPTTAALQQPAAVNHMLNLKRLYERSTLRPVTKATDLMPSCHLLMPMNITNTIPYNRFCLRPSSHQPTTQFQ